MVCMVPITVFAQEGEPRHPAIVHFEEIGRIDAGASIVWPLGDVSGDGIDDFAIKRYLDTSFSVAGYPNPRSASEVAILYGRQGELPRVEDAVRIGPEAIGIDEELLAVGDWDGRNGLDIVVRYEDYLDTTFKKSTDYPTYFTVVFWNDGTGRYRTNDTTRLWPGEFEAGNVVTKASSIDFDQNGVEDLVLQGGTSALLEGELRKNIIPRLRVHLGEKDKPIANKADWKWWNAPDNVDRLESQDLDHDGAQDLILYINESNSPLTVLYGRSDGQFPDTIYDRQQITINGLAANFSDVTGDNYADLVILNSAQDFVYCYVSTPSARRMQDMFGTGNDPPREGEWWSRPWATLKGPKLVNQFWLSLSEHLFPLGSADTSAPDEIWVQSWPYILIYRTGIRLDSIIDAEFDIRIVGGVPLRIGDINGDNRDEFAMAADPITVFKFPEALPSTVGRARKVPDGTDTPDSVSGVEECLTEEVWKATTTTMNLW